MLTWPCVTIEWKTPPIHTVVVSEASSGTRRSPVRRICPCGRRLARSFAGSTTCAASGAEEGEQPPVALPRRRGARRRTAPPARPARVGAAASSGASLKSVARARDGDAAAPSARRRGLGQRQRAIDEREVGGAAGVRMVRLEPGEEAERGARAGRQRQRLVLQHRHRVLVLAAHAGQALGRQRRPAARRRASTSPWSWSASVQKLAACRERADRRATGGARRPRGSAAPPARRRARDARAACDRRTGSRSTRSAARRRSPRARRPARGPDRPSRRSSPAFSSATCQNHAGADAASTSDTRKRMPVPLAGDLEPCSSTPHRARAARAEQRRPVDARAVAAQVEVGGAALELVAEEGVHDHVAVIDAPDRAVPVHLHREPDGLARRSGPCALMRVQLSLWMGCALHVRAASSTRRRSWWAASASSDANVTTVIERAVEQAEQARRGVGAEQRAGPLEHGKARRCEQHAREREALLVRQRQHVVPVALDVKPAGARDLSSMPTARSTAAIRASSTSSLLLGRAAAPRAASPAAGRAARAGTGSRRAAAARCAPRPPSTGPRWRGRAPCAPLRSDRSPARACRGGTASESDCSSALPVAPRAQRQALPRELRSAVVDLDVAARCRAVTCSALSPSADEPREHDRVRPRSAGTA